MSYGKDGDGTALENARSGELILMTRSSTDPDLTDRDRDILLRMEAKGWFVNTVGATEDEPGFAYSFGLYQTFQHPEIIVFGLAENMMHRLINDIGDQLRGGFKGYRDGSKSSDLLADYGCEFHHVDPAWYRTTLTWASWFYTSPNFPALQLCWPDKNGSFPWERECNEKVRALQPDLSKPSNIN